jgi:hypothetical protein
MISISLLALFVLLSKMYGGATFDLDRKVHMAHIAIILSENNLSDIIIEEIVCITYNLWEKTKVETLSAVYTKNQNSKTVIKTIIDGGHLWKIIDQK